MGGDPTGSRGRDAVEVRTAAGRLDHVAAGAVTARAYEEFQRYFDPAEWAEYARTLPVTAPRVEQGELLVAADPSGAVIGTATLYLEPKPTSGHWRDRDAMVRFLAVDPPHRNQGVGGALFAACLDRATRAGKHRLALQTTPHMTVAIRMYEDRGFYRDPDGDMVFGSFALQGFAKDLHGSAAE